MLSDRVETRSESSLDGRYGGPLTPCLGAGNDSLAEGQMSWIDESEFKSKLYV